MGEEIPNNDNPWGRFPLDKEFAKKLAINLNEIEKEKKDKREEDKKNEENLKRQNAESKLTNTNRIELKDKMFFSSSKENGNYFIENIQFINYLFIRGVATNFLFKNIDFSKTIFDSCYLKDCRFINCKFEGAKFMNCNLQGSYFSLCNFDYAIFEKTFIDDEIFECAPKKDNLKYKFARSLKLNYASIGDYIRSSKAVSMELEATKSHLKDSWLSGEEWYILKYGGPKRRIEQFWKWIKVSVLDFVWGNGESLWRLVRFNLIIFSVLTLYDIFKKNINNALEIFQIFIIKIPSNYFGIVVKNADNTNYFDYYPLWLNLILVIMRLLCFGLLTSIIIKKYNRR